MHRHSLIILSLVLLLPMIAYDLATKRIPSRLQFEQAPKSESGIIPVDGFGSDADSDGVDIIFVHGLGSNPDTTWTSPVRHNKSAATDNKKTVSWITDFLPQDLQPSIREHTRVYYYNHDSYWKRDAIETRLYRLGEGLLQRIRLETRRNEEERKRGLVFVGHSFGGLIIKQALIQASIDKKYADILDHTNTILFLGTPHDGSKVVRWATIIAKALQPIGSNPSIIRDLAYGSVPIKDLHRQFVAVTDNRVRIVNIFEKRKIVAVKFWFIQRSIFCVEEDSATYDGPSIDNIGLDVDHFGLNKFGSKTADEYKIVSGKLLEPLEEYSSRLRGRYSVPLRIASSYVDRSELSLKFEEKLHERENETDSPSGLLIHGLGGAGKTQLALRYVEKHRNSYDPVLWVDAKDPEAVRSSFVRCADEMHLIPVDSTHKTGTDLADFRPIQIVNRWLEARKSPNKRFLVVFDNADDLLTELKTLVPQAGRGSVIITSQDSLASKPFTKYEKLRVDIMESLEARAVLLQHLRRESNSIPSYVQTLCDNIARKLGYLALAVDLAGAYIEYEIALGTALETALETALAQYLEDFSRHKDDLLQQDQFRGLPETDKTVWTVWDKTLDRIQDLDRKCRPDLLLTFLSHFRGSIVQDELFRLASIGLSKIQSNFSRETDSFPAWLKAWTELKEDQWDDFCYRKARNLLVRYSLIQRSNEGWPGLTIHRLVQWRASMYEKEQPWEVWFLTIFTAICSQSLIEWNKSQFRRYIIPHLSAGSALEAAAEGLSEKMRILFKMFIGTLYLVEGRYEKAEELLKQTLNLTKSILGKEHDLTHISMNKLAVTYMYQGRWKEAEELAVEVMEIAGGVNGEEHPGTLISISNLASAYSMQGRWKEAEELEVGVMETMKKVLGEEHPDTLNSMGRLASIYRVQGRLRDAEVLGVRAMETTRKVLGEEHPDTLKSMTDLGFTYRSQGRLKDFDVLAVRIMELTKTALREEHRDTLGNMVLLSFVWKAQGQNTKAINLLQACIRQQSRILGAQHPDTLILSAELADWQDPGYDSFPTSLFMITKKEPKTIG